MRRRMFVATAGSIGTMLLAGCSGGDDGTDPVGGSSTDDGSTTGSFRLLISDQPAAIEDFDSLEVTLSAARVFQAGDGEEVTEQVVTDTVTASPGSTPTDTPANGTTVPATATGTAADDAATSTEDGAGAGYVVFDLDDVTVDLTRVVGDRAVAVLEDELEEGRYSGIALQVASVAGVVNGEDVEVMVPSDRLRIVKPFEVAADATLSFVFDINVVQKGPQGSYNLLPVIGKSGVAGEDADVEEVDAGDA